MRNDLKIRIHSLDLSKHFPSSNGESERWRVSKCSRCKHVRPPAPMLQNDIWSKIAKRREALCANCMFERMRKTGLQLEFVYLKPCVSNLEHGWFDRLLAAGAIGSHVPSDIAYSWQLVMISRSNRLKEGSVIADRPARGTPLFANSGGWQLLDAPEGGVIYMSDAAHLMHEERYLKVTRPDGELMAELLVEFDNEECAHIKDFVGWHGPNSLGTAGARTVLRLFQSAFPKVQALSGLRITGARKRAASVTIAM